MHEICKKYQLHDSAACRAEVCSAEVTRGNDQRDIGQILPGSVRNVSTHAVKAKRMAMFCARKCLSQHVYHMVGSHHLIRLPISRMPALHSYIRSAANAKSPQRSDRRPKSLVGGRLCGPPFNKDHHCPSMAPQARSHREPLSLSSLHDCALHSSNSPYTYLDRLCRLLPVICQVTLRIVTFCVGGFFGLMGARVSHGQQLV